MLVSFLSALFVSLLIGQDWERADQETRRFRPSAFPRLPPAIRGDLERRGCTIPQPVTAKRPVNIISGRFTRPHEVDWAVLCSIQRVSSILVFRGGSPLNVAEIERKVDAAFLQVIEDDGRGNPVVGFSRLIEAANPNQILRYWREVGGPKPPPLDHDAIEHIFVEKGSSILYWYRERWLVLEGAD
jgi:hypothetical protein